MPHGTRVESCYTKLKKEGKSEGSAAAICQSSTKQGLASGRSLKKSVKSLMTKYKKKT